MSQSDDRRAGKDRRVSPAEMREAELERRKAHGRRAADTRWHQTPATPHTRVISIRIDDDTFDAFIKMALIARMPVRSVIYHWLNRFDPNLDPDAP